MRCLPHVLKVGLIIRFSRTAVLFLPFKVSFDTLENAVDLTDFRITGLFGAFIGLLFFVNVQERC